MSTLSVNPVMYLIAESGNPMSAGKLGAQLAHAAVEAYRISPDDRLKHIWSECGKHYAKVVLETDNLFMTNLYLTERGFMVVPIIDEARTELEGLTLTALGVQIVDKNRADVAATFRQFKLYRGPKPAPVEEPEKRSFTTKLKERWRAYATRRNQGDT